MFKRLRERIEESLEDADTSVSNIEFAILEFIEDMEKGVSFSVEIAGKEFPVKINMVPNAEEEIK